MDTPSSAFASLASSVVFKPSLAIAFSPPYMTLAWFRKLRFPHVIVRIEVARYFVAAAAFPVSTCLVW